MKTTGTLHSDNTYRYIAPKRDCDNCPLKPHCAPKSGPRRVLRDPNEKARDYTRALVETEVYGASRAERKKIERLFGEATQILSMVRLRLRGLTGARDEFLLTAPPSRTSKGLPTTPQGRHHGSQWPDPCRKNPSNQDKNTNPPQQTGVENKTSANSNSGHQNRVRFRVDQHTQPFPEVRTLLRQ